MPAAYEVEELSDADMNKVVDATKAFINGAPDAAANDAELATELQRALQQYNVFTSSLLLKVALRPSSANPVRLSPRTPPPPSLPP